MKRNDKTTLLQLAQAELTKRQQEMQVELMKAMQERNLPNKTGMDVKRASRLRAEIKMIKAELTRRAGQPEQAQE